MLVLLLSFIINGGVICASRQLKLAVQQNTKYDYNFSTSFLVVVIVVVVVKLACNQIYMCQQCLCAIRTVGCATAIKRGATYQQVARATSTATTTTVSFCDFGVKLIYAIVC